MGDLTLIESSLSSRARPRYYPPTPNPPPTQPPTPNPPPYPLPLNTYPTPTNFPPRPYPTKYLHM